MRLVCTPWEHGSLRSANTTLIYPLGLVSVEIIIQNEPHRHIFAVPPSCSHDIILGWDFLVTRRALIDCETKSLYLSKVTPGVEPLSYNRVSFRATSNTRISPFTAALIQLTADLPDSDYLLEPNLEVFFQKGLALPFALTRSRSCISTVLVANTTNI